MARAFDEENERVKRKYLDRMGEAHGCDPATLDKIADALLLFEQSTKFKSFKTFHIEQAKRFKAEALDATSSRTGQSLALSTVSGRLSLVKAFFVWLSYEVGYKSRISYQDADYFNLTKKDQRIAHTSRGTPYPTMQQCKRAFEAMPNETILDRRNRAIFACLMLTGARDGALTSFQLKLVDLEEGFIEQDARYVNTKAAKSFRTFLLPSGEAYQDCFAEWVNLLRDDLCYGFNDALFPKLATKPSTDGFQVLGLSRDPYSNTGPIRYVIKKAFENAELPPFTSHSFRKTLTKWADRHYQSREAFKAFSQNIGHNSVITTVSNYCPVSTDRQGELIRGA